MQASGQFHSPTSFAGKGDRCTWERILGGLRSRSGIFLEEKMSCHCVGDQDYNLQLIRHKSWWAVPFNIFYSIIAIMCGTEEAVIRMASLTMF